MRASLRCKDVFHGARCAKYDGHRGDHATEFAEWNENTDKTLRLPSMVKVRKDRVTMHSSRAFKFYLACRQYNREHGQVATSTGEIVRRKVERREFERLAEAGRLR